MTEGCKGSDGDDEDAEDSPLSLGAERECQEMLLRLRQLNVPGTWQWESQSGNGIQSREGKTGRQLEAKQVFLVQV